MTPSDTSTLPWKDLPSHSHIVIVGGGIHGVGVAHDLASRGMQDILLLEKSTLGSGTSSWSTKIIHGGLRYLQRPNQIALVKENLKERYLLSQLAKDLIHPISLLYPINKHGGRSALTVKAGLWLYDKLAGKYNFGSYSSCSAQEIKDNYPQLKEELFSKAFRFFDAQTDDVSLVLRVASSAIKCGATIAEGIFVEHITPSSSKYTLTLMNSQGERSSLSCKYLILATGPWSHELLERSSMRPQKIAIKNRGSHLLFDNIGLKSGLFLESQSKNDSRIFFALPWHNLTLVGTTEALYQGPVDSQKPSEEDIHYLLNNINHYLKDPLKLEDIRYTFSGLRWLVKQGSLSSASRESVIVSQGDRNKHLWTIYGGKLTSYRLLAKRLADKITAHDRHYSPSLTHLPSKWVNESPAPEPLSKRFISQR
ncbi:MAG: FAD-dependent oxidoreductase [Proteobacteria bacterium]|nr:FAD-dependent oxidoreductase [Pseudomonadota bacterium]